MTIKVYAIDTDYAELPTQYEGTLESLMNEYDLFIEDGQLIAEWGNGEGFDRYNYEIA